MTAARIWLALVVGLAVAATASLWLQRETRAVLQAELAQLREENAELGRVREERIRLVAQRTAPEEVSRLRADHAAVVRLRGEIEALRESVERREAAVAAAGAKAKERPWPEPARASSAISLRADPDGRLLLDGHPLDLAAFRQQLAQVPKEQEIEIRIKPPTGERTARLEAFAKNVDEVSNLARELRVRHTLKIESSPQ